MGGEVAIPQSEPVWLHPVGVQLRLDGPGLVRATPAAFRIGTPTKPVHDAVEIWADPQAVQAEVVADVDHRGHLGPDGLSMRPHAAEKAGTTDAAGQHHDVHVAHPRRSPVQRKWRPTTRLNTHDDPVSQVTA